MSCIHFNVSMEIFKLKLSHLLSVTVYTKMCLQLGQQYVS